MASGFVCDRCGKAIFPKENTQFFLGLEGPNHHIKTTEGGMDSGATYADLDFCPGCASAVADIIVRRIITKQTNMDAWVIADEPNGKKAKSDG